MVLRIPLKQPAKRLLDFARNFKRLFVRTASAISKLALKKIKAIGASIVIIALIAFLINIYLSNSVDIRIVSVPKPLAEQGYTERSISERLRSQILTMIVDAKRPAEFPSEDTGDAIALLDQNAIHSFHSIFPSATIDYLLSVMRETLGARHSTVLISFACTAPACSLSDSLLVSASVSMPGNRSHTISLSLVDSRSYDDTTPMALLSPLESKAELALSQVATSILEIFEPLLAARLALRERDFVRADLRAMRVSNSLGATEEEIIGAGLILVASAIEQGRFDTARERIRELEETAPAALQPHIQIASALIEARKIKTADIRERFEELEDRLSHVIELLSIPDLEPRLASLALLNKGINRLKFVDHSDSERAHQFIELAQNDLEEARTLDPFNPVIYFYLGAAQRKQCNFEQALQQYYRALSIDPNYGTAERALGFSYRRASLDERAEGNNLAADTLGQRGVSAYERALDLSANRHISHLNLAVMLMDTGELEQAKFHLIESDKNFPPRRPYDRAALYLGMIAACECDYEAALNHYEAALVREPTSESDRQRLHQVYAEIQRVPLHARGYRPPPFWQRIDAVMTDLQDAGFVEDNCQVRRPDIQRCKQCP